MAKISLIANEERAQIAEHAFRAGYHAAVEEFLGRAFHYDPKVEQWAWDGYEPEEKL